MVKCVSVVSRKSTKSDVVYTCVEVDLVYKKCKLFADNGTYQTLTNLNPMQFATLELDLPVILECSSLSLVKAHSDKKNVDYVYMLVDVGYTQVKLFVDNFILCEIFDITPKQLYNVQINEPIKIKVGD